jgi:hypothetical protein
VSGVERPQIFMSRGMGAEIAWKGADVEATELVPAVSA